MGDAADDAFQALWKIFSKPMKRFKGCGRTYVLEFIAGQPVFRRDEIELMIDDAITKVYGPAGDRGDDIVPKKLAAHFPPPS